MIYVSQKMLNWMSDDRLAAILAHEYGHLLKHDMYIQHLVHTATNLAAILIVFLFSPVIGEQATLLALGVFCLVTTLLRLRRQRKMEVVTDSIASSLAGGKEMVGALEAISDYGLLPATSPSWFHRQVLTHPPLGERINRLEHTSERHSE